MREDHDPLSEQVIGAAIRVHRHIGPGCLESAYEECVAWVLLRSGLKVRRQCLLPIVFEGRRIRAAYRLDLVVADRLIVEVKSVERLLPVHEAQVRTYLRMSGLRVGLLLNFNAPVIKDGIRRISL